MAIFKPGVIAAAVSGRLGSVCFVHRRSGDVLRTFQHRGPRSTSRTLSQQSAWSYVRAEWEALSDAEKLIWETLANTFARSNRLALTVPWTGRQFFMQQNVLYFLQEQLIWSEPMTYFMQNPVQWLTVTCQNGGPVTLFPSSYYLNYPPYWVLYVQRPVSSSPSKPGLLLQSAARRAFNNPAHQVQATSEPTIGVPAIGERLFYRLRRWRHGVPYSQLIDGSVAVPDEGIELVTPWDFETSVPPNAVTGWTLTGEGTALATATFVYGDDVCCHIEMDALAANSELQLTAPFPVTLNRTYRCRLAVRRTSGDNPHLRFYDGVSPSQDLGALTCATADLWYTFDVDAVARSTSASGRVGLRWTTGQSCDVRVDNISVRETPAP